LTSKRNVIFSNSNPARAIRIGGNGCFILLGGSEE
jgi:hypothetical protein